MQPILSYGLFYVPHVALNLILSYDGRDFSHQSLRFRDLRDVRREMSIRK